MGWEIPQKWAFQALSSEISDLWVEKSNWNEHSRLYRARFLPYGLRNPTEMSSIERDFGLMGWEIPLKWAFQILSSTYQSLIWFEKSLRNEQFRRYFWFMCWEIIQKWTLIFSVKPVERGLDLVPNFDGSSTFARNEKERQNTIQTHVKRYFSIMLSMFWDSSKSE